ncbi:hypothetical protein JL09_g7022 [Pichia kudriavzevii]|uniref:Uncharacterized protein n=1 Tax=Pichia kudriavzevii TaxID=4909 RepID=A0A099NKA9_PICKU|nr:hypothetical protein JL09_g7036 [Pichia kudriavzevii]KGK32371.1 hypothetical protein JL09_g7022 [Pichia kudriavzevii]
MSVPVDNLVTKFPKEAI